MGADQGVIKASGTTPVFLSAMPGDVVIVWEHPELVDSDTDGWWMGEVLYVEGSARNPKAPSLFQIADVDSGLIHWINADCVQKILTSVKGWQSCDARATRSKSRTR